MSWCLRAISTMPSSTSRGYRAPVGLLGLMMTIALVRGVILDSMSLRSGYHSASSSQM